MIQCCYKRNSSVGLGDLKLGALFHTPPTNIEDIDEFSRFNRLGVASIYVSPEICSGFIEN
jgi:hypothetical protein